MYFFSHCCWFPKVLVFTEALPFSISVPLLPNAFIEDTGKDLGKLLPWKQNDGSKNSTIILNPTEGAHWFKKREFTSIKIEGIMFSNREQKGRRGKKNSICFLLFILEKMTIQNSHLWHCWDIPFIVSKKQEDLEFWNRYSGPQILTPFLQE